MPTTEENIQFLYLILTQGGAPTVDWHPICAALSLEKGAVTKRWSRLKQAMEKGEKPAESNYEFLWLMVTHSTRDKKYDWDAIAQACNSTKGACSKRYSRMKLAIERGDAPPSTPLKSKKDAAATPKTTPARIEVKSEEDDAGTPTPTPKRKRALAKNYTEAEDDEDEQDEKLKRAKSTPKSKPRPTNAFRASDERDTEEASTTIQGEPFDEDGDVFTDALEHASADVADEGELDEVSSTSIFSDKFTNAQEMADVLVNSQTPPTSEQRTEAEGISKVLDDFV
ncbi:uncharacterized protein M421DRAFT_5647 [Didymella exigua CBS 183.55]|uniref:Myb-like DNA-binding domain-containing protein n=1 Tax=Didymella exigua CBS 183.55 TaxID=1150837 RepID=A0A6A5RLX0_9PLEO|nr:uncharacterized protein M421DRAFT_5647 [Didymella exigua CBS 183.55]KAF1927984.1 hypothetical protein M421DRAFT_5647 [Didymella exigua CBS 183.55]